MKGIIVKQLCVCMLVIRTGFIYLFIFELYTCSFSVQWDLEVFVCVCGITEVIAFNWSYSQVRLQVSILNCVSAGRLSFEVMALPLTKVNAPSMTTSFIIYVIGYCILAYLS